MNACIQATHPIDWKTDYGRKAAAAHLSGKLNTGIPSGGIVWRVQWIGG
jgi:hypothetical protein